MSAEVPKAFLDMYPPKKSLEELNSLEKLLVSHVTVIQISGRFIARRLLKLLIPVDKKR